MLDLRGVDPLSKYTHGYMDPGDVMWLAGWAALRQFVELEQPQDPAEWWTPEEALEPHNIRHKANHDEAMALYRYWMEERREEERELDALYREIPRKPRPENKDVYESKMEVWMTRSREMEERAEKMWLRLAALRLFLWY
jgi:hypothetical protein